MKTLSVFITGLALAIACPPPLNNPMFLDVNDTAAVLNDFVLNNGLGSIDAVSDLANPRQPWPWSNNQGTKGNQISYCFYSEFVRNDFQDLLTAGWEMWSSKLGDAGPDAGHALRVREYPWAPDTPPEKKYCWIDMGWSIWGWNLKMPSDTLIIDYKKNGGGAAAITGWIPPDRDSAWGCHNFVINKALAGGQGDDNNVKTIAHEWGHIFGLWHEHQRDDRDHYVRFYCGCIDGYLPAKNKVIADGKYTVEQLCNDPDVAVEYNFPSWQYALKPPSDGAEWQFTKSDEYDLKSVMHYISSYYVNPGCLALKNPIFVPLSHWKEGGPDFEPPAPGVLPPKDALEYIVYKNEPSELDVAAMKRIYPWKE